jgi:fatty acid-binding protein DegV
MFRLHGRRISARAKFGSRGRAIDGMCKAARDAARRASYVGVAVHHGANDREAVELAARIEREVGPDDLYVTSFTPVMGAHVGPGVVGVSICALPA